MICSWEGCEDKVRTKEMCRRHYHKEFRRKNRDRLIQAHRIYNLNNRDKIVAAQKEYRHNNKDKIAARSREYRLRNKDKIKEYRKNNRQQRLVYAKTYRDNNKGTRQEWNKNNKDKIEADRIKARYGITVDERDDMRKEQHYRCFICGAHENTLTLGLCIDHDHETNQVRGLLCSKCNSGIGMLKDDPELLQNGIDWLNKHNV